MHRLFVLFAFVAIIIVNYQYCSLGDRLPTNGPAFKLSFRSSTLNNSILTQVRRLTFCFKSIRFIPYIDLNNPDPNAKTHTLDFNVDDVDYLSSGTDISYVSVPSGAYQTIQLFLTPQCASGRSLHITNNNGIFSTLSDITLTFTASPLTINDNTSRVNLNLDNIITNLLSVTAENQIKTAAESSSGSF